MQIDVQARGFTLTPALAAAARRAARVAATHSGDKLRSVQVRLFDVNGARGGIDKGCMVSARVGSLSRTVVATSFDADLYRAIAQAFDKLDRGLLSAAHRQYTLRRRPRGLTPELS